MTNQGCVQSVIEWEGHVSLCTNPTPIGVPEADGSYGSPLSDRRRNIL